MARALASLVVTALLACGGGERTLALSRPIRDPTGAQAWWIECVESLGRCYALAGRQCPSGYELLDSDRMAGATTTGKTTGQLDQRGSFVAKSSSETSPTFRGSLIIKCRATPSPAQHQPAPPQTAPTAAHSLSPPGSTGGGATEPSDAGLPVRDSPF
jgi:hypothetical protein